MSKSIMEQIEELQLENERMKEYEKLLDKAIKLRLGKSIKELENILKNRVKTSKFEEDLCSYFSLKTDADKDQFVELICCDATLNFIDKKLAQYSQD